MALVLRPGLRVYNAMKTLSDGCFVKQLCSVDKEVMYVCIYRVGLHIYMYL